jgi:hypothetical protein
VLLRPSLRWSLSDDILLQIKIDELTIESAKSSLAYNTASKESTINDAVPYASLRAFSRIAHAVSLSQANASFNNVLLGLPPSHGRIALAKTKASSSRINPSRRCLTSLPSSQDVSAEDILRVIRTYIQPIFDPSTSLGSIASGAAKMEDIASHFEELGYDVERRTFGEGDDESGSDCGSESGSESEDEAK